MTTHAAVVGVGFTPTTSPRRQTQSKLELCREAVDSAIEHAGCERDLIDAVVFGNIDGFEATNMSAKTVVPGLGLRPDVPVYIVNTGGTTGGNLPNLAATLVRAEEHRAVVCIGPSTFDGPIDLQAVINTCSPMAMEQPLGMGAVHMGAFFPAAYQDRYKVSDEDFVAVAEKNVLNAAHNPFAHIRSPVAPGRAQAWVSTPLQLSMVCPVSSGACAIVIASEGVAESLANPVVRISAYGSASDPYLGGGRHDFSSFELAGILGERVYREAQVMDPRTEIDVVELFNPYAPMEFMLLEDLQFCGRGEAPELLRQGVTLIDGDLPVNLSGGVQCTNPGVAAQLAPVGYVALQLMGQAVGGRQVEGARRGLAHATGGAFFQFHTIAILESR